MESRPVSFEQATHGVGLITLRVGGSKENQKENLPFWRVRPEKREPLSPDW